MSFLFFSSVSYSSSTFFDWFWLTCARSWRTDISTWCWRDGNFSVPGTASSFSMIGKRLKFRRGLMQVYDSKSLCFRVRNSGIYQLKCTLKMGILDSLLRYRDWATMP
jgi:hypothetical protein